MKGRNDLNQYSKFTNLYHTIPKQTNPSILFLLTLILWVDQDDISDSYY